MKVNVIGKPKKDKKEVAVSKDFQDVEWPLVY